MSYGSETGVKMLVWKSICNIRCAEVPVPGPWGGVSQELTSETFVSRTIRLEAWTVGLGDGVEQQQG